MATENQTTKQNGLAAPWWSPGYARSANQSSLTGLELERQRRAGAPANDPAKALIQNGVAGGSPENGDPAGLAPPTPAPSAAKPLVAEAVKPPEVQSVPAATSVQNDSVASASQPTGKQTAVPGVTRYDETGKAPLFSNVGTGAAAQASPRAGTPLVSGLQGGSDVMGILQRERQIRNEMTPLRDQIAFNAGTGGLPLIRQRGNDEALRDMMFSDNIRAKDAALRYMGGREDAAVKQAASLRDEAFRQRELDAKQGMADREFGLKNDEQAMKMDAARQKQELQKQFMAEQDPSKKKEIAGQLAVIDGQYGSLGSNDLAKARMGLVGEIAKAYNGPMGVPLGPDKNPIPFDQYADPIMRAAGASVGQPEKQQTPGTVSAGQVINGYRFKGGDPSKQSSWEKA